MNRFELALKIYEKLNPNAALDGEDTNLQTGFVLDRGESRWRLGTAGLASYIHAIGPLPYYTVLLGICTDGFPLLLDLEHYQTGPILITGSHSTAMRDFMKSALDSARIINPPGLIEFLLVTSKAGALESSFANSSASAVEHPADRSVQALIMHLCALVEQRNAGRQRGATLILAIEDLDTLIRHLHQDVYAHFLWLLREGPFARVWPIATLHAGSRLFTDFKFESLFETRIQVGNLAPSGSSNTGTGDYFESAYHRVITNGQTFDVALP